MQYLKNVIGVVEASRHALKWLEWTPLGFIIPSCRCYKWK